MESDRLASKTQHSRAHTRSAHGGDFCGGVNKFEPTLEISGGDGGGIERPNESVLYTSRNMVEVAGEVPTSARQAQGLGNPWCKHGLAFERAPCNAFSRHVYMAIVKINLQATNS